MIYLYIKTHNKTGLKYLGKTLAKNPHLYKGSGKVWKNHCEKYGYDYTTEIIFQSENKNEIREKGLYYSNLWNIVESKDWANLKKEECDGGFCEKSITPEANLKRSNKLKGRIFTEEHRKKISEAKKGKYYHSEETKHRAAEKASIKLKGRKKPEGFGEKISILNKNRIFSEESKTKMRKAWTNERKEKQAERTRIQNASRPNLTCPHCGKQGKSHTMFRYHFDKCKKILIES